MLHCRSVVLLCLISVVWGTCIRDEMNSASRSFTVERRNVKGEYVNMTLNATTNLEEIRDTGRFLRKFFITTCDGYILTVMRLVNKAGTVQTNRSPVLFAHGLFQSSDIFLNQGEKQSLAFALSDRGFDVWLANTRGNKYGRQHLYLEPETDEKMDFFNHTYEELAKFDIAAIVDFIVNETLSKKIIYIGHSLGGTLFLVLNSLEPAYNDRFEKAYLVAPFAYQERFPNKNILLTMENHQSMFESLTKYGIVELYPPAGKGANATFSALKCMGVKRYNFACEVLHIPSFMHLNGGQTYTKEETRGGSIKILEHLGQNVVSKKFRRWDYGEEINLKHYGCIEPPLYDVYHVTVPTVIIYAPNDEFVHEDDILNLVKDMANATAKKIEKDNFRHGDFVDAENVMEVVYKDILREGREPDGGTALVAYHWTILLLIGLQLVLT